MMKQVSLISATLAEEMDENEYRQLTYRHIIDQPRAGYAVWTANQVRPVWLTVDEFEKIFHFDV